MKKLLVILCILSFGFVTAQELKYHRVAIDLNTTNRQKLLESGITIDHSYSHDNVIETEISEIEIKLLDANKIPYKIIIYDMALYYASRNIAEQQNAAKQVSGGCNDPNPAIPSHFHLGSMGGYFTLDELENILDSMALLYPSLVKAKAAISTTTSIEGRNIWYVKFSDNPNVDENEPEILYTALHHAREGGSLSQLIFYMWYLLENYATDPGIQAVLNNTELYFVPCVNPDGYKYNELTNPSGGGMWRKNRRDNGDGTFGIDINRNYGVNWGYDNVGSSPIPGSDVYRGTAAFSEPETQAMKAFCESRNFKNALNAHTYSNDFIFPWGHIDDFQTNDSVTYKKWAALLTKDSRFHYGTCSQTLMYNVNGGSDDWMYGEQSTKGKIFAMTPESGSYWDGFWPPSSRIVDICRLTFSQNLNLALLALNYVEMEDRQDKFIRSNGYLHFEVTPLSLSPGSFTVTISPVGTGITSVGAAKVYTATSHNQIINDSISFVLASNLAGGQQLQYKLTVNDGYTSQSKLLTKIYGTPLTLFYEDGSFSTAIDPQTKWGKSNTRFVSPPSSITDSPNGNYQPGDVKMLVTDEINLNNAVYAHAQFYTRFLVEKTFDEVKMSISTNNGLNYTPLCGKYSTPLSSFAGTEPIYDGRQDDWVLEEIDLNAYLNKKILLRFELTVDNYNEKDGFYIDDILVRKIPTNLVGLNEKGVTESITIHPNPSNGRFTVEAGSRKDLHITVYNSLGVIIKNQSAPGPVFIDLSEQSNGVYLILLKDENTSVIKKVILAR